MDRVTDFSNLPEVFQFRPELNGPIMLIKEPVYNLLAPGFYGEGKAATWYDEGEIIQSWMEPNAHMQPLNKAAGERTMAWLSTLETAGGSINIEDLTEATNMIARNPKLADMTPEQIAKATHKLATDLKHKRDGTRGLVLPPMAGDTIHTIQQAGRKPPAMLGAKFVDAQQLGPGGRGGAEIGDQRLRGASAPPPMNQPRP